MNGIYEQYKNFKSFEMDFLDESNVSHKLICKVIRVDADKLIVSADKLKNNLTAKLHNELTLYVYTDNGIFTSNSSVIFLEDAVSSTIYHISYPYNNKHSQRREYFRADIEVPFVMHITRNNSMDTLEGITKNICGKGICFDSTRPFLPYKKIELILKFEDNTICVNAELVYSRTIIEDTHPQFIHAFLLTNIYKPDINYIVQKCFLSQLHREKSDL